MPGPVVAEEVAAPPGRIAFPHFVQYCPPRVSSFPHRSQYMIHPLSGNTPHQPICSEGFDRGTLQLSDSWLTITGTPPCFWSVSLRAFRPRNLIKARKVKNMPIP